MNKIIGIDFGTSNSRVAVFEGSQPVVIPFRNEKNAMPSVVSRKNGAIEVGETAKQHAILNPDQTIFSVKQCLGAMISGRSLVPKPEETIAMILKELKKNAENYLGQKVTDAVVAIPATFAFPQRKSVKEACRIAGLHVRRFVVESTAAALAYGFDNYSKDMIVAVVNHGGGFINVSIIDMGGGVFEVISTNGNSHIGGNAFNQVIVDWLVNEFQREEHVDLRSDTTAMQRLEEAAEKAKIELSTSMSAEINLPYIINTRNGFKHISKVLTRCKFELLSYTLVEECREVYEKAIRDAMAQYEDTSAFSIDKVVLTGGSCRIPALQQVAKECFGVLPSKELKMDEAVVVGACIQGAILNHESPVDMILLDCTSQTIGLETTGDMMCRMIEANKMIPCRESKLFTTSKDDQTEISLRILQGNSPIASKNIGIGILSLTGITPAPRGVPQIEVSFNIDANGILTVSANNKTTGEKQSVRIDDDNNPLVGTASIGNVPAMLTTDEQDQPKKVYDVFISYSSKDQKTVEDVCGYLERNGIRCFVAYRDIPKGTKWAKAIADALKDSKMMVAIFSEYFNLSEETDREIECAADRKMPILTFRLTNSKFEGLKWYFLQNLNWIDAFPDPNKSFGELYENVIRLIK